jgi:hypothetical protein
MKRQFWKDTTTLFFVIALLFGGSLVFLNATQTTPADIVNQLFPAEDR